MDKNLDKLDLKDTILPSTVQAKVTVESWEEAADFVGGLLLGQGLILPSYIEAMKNACREMGPYMVIAPGIALLHARPEDGVVHPCLSLLTLRNPVEFGHSENDPVDIVIALGAVDKNSHIAALQQLASLLGNTEKIQLIRSAVNSSDLYNVLVK